MPPPAEERLPPTPAEEHPQASIARAPPDLRVIFMVDSVDGRMLRSDDCKEAIVTLNSEKTHLVASMDSCNAPLLWTSHLWNEANWLLTDAPTFAW